MWFSVTCFGVRVSVMFHLMFVKYTLSSVWVAEWPPFGKELPAQLAICSHCLLSICIFIYFLFLLRFNLSFKHKQECVISFVKLINFIV